MEIGQIFSVIDAHVGTEVDINGVFYHSDGIGYLSASDDGTISGTTALKVAISDLKTMLLRKVPAYGGGRYLYAHPAHVRGTLCSSDSLEFQYELRDIVSFALECEDMSFVVLS